MAFELPNLPFAKDALNPHISPETLDYHHGKHHNAYVTNLNNLVKGKAEENKTLEEIIQTADGGVFNNAAQTWNHSFYWNCLSGNGGGEPTGELAEQIKKDFGSYEDFRREFSNAAATQFGSGWAWLVWENGKLKIDKTANADTPVRTSTPTLLTIDVWEHAYYIDYRNARPKYIDTFLDHLVNWDFVAENLNKAK